MIVQSIYCKVEELSHLHEFYRRGHNENEHTIMEEYQDLETKYESMRIQNAQLSRQVEVERSEAAKLQHRIDEMSTVMLPRGELGF